MSNERDAFEAVDLSDFVQSALTSIIRGVKGAQVETEGLSDLWGMNPIAPSLSENGKFATTSGSIGVQVVEFDVGVVATAERKGGAGVQIKVFRAGVDIAKERAVEQRIKFTVPVAIPFHNTKKDR